MEDKKTVQSKDYIPVYAYVAKYKISKQNLYRWIRERKIEGKYKRVKKEVERILILDEPI